MNEQERDLWSHYEHFPPPAYDPANSLPLPERAMAPTYPCPRIAFPSELPERIFIRPPPSPPGAFCLIAPATWTVTPAPRTPSPDPDQSLSQPQRPGNSDNEMSSLEPPSSDQDSETPWMTSLPSTEEAHYLSIGSVQPSRPRSLPIETGKYTILQQDTRSPTYEQEALRSSMTWRVPYLHSPSNRATDQTWTDPTTFDHFNYDYRMFRGLDNVNPWTQRVDEYVPYPFALPDSPSTH
ncbi:hypothetical protein ARMSODRAFT_1010488 [Armillaria solidipes]|uniref:Uncharacterized protein n=1 Tax=Armillaria solidipes TaxID=1076256 RepID=A0A2H3C456_9AGAR|nr:hypothetical protein ARMSODRAFT_1010488 [Armillaria solidipes]